MFGDDWVVAPVYTHGATSRSVYLPALVNAEWVYWYNASSVGSGGGRITMPTPIGEFPLFSIRPITPPPPPSFFNSTTFYSAQRNDTVLCVTSACYNANAPGLDGDYVRLRSEGVALLSDDGSGHVTLAGVTYPVSPLNLFYSVVHGDNFVSTNSTPPDASYFASNGGTQFANGFVLTAPAPGAMPLQLWYKRFSGTSQDYASVASPEGIAWVTAAGYTLLNAGGASGGGWVLPDGTTEGQMA
jgi:hypothetical protein